MLITNKSTDKPFAIELIIHILEKYSTKVKVVQSMDIGPILVENPITMCYNEIEQQGY